MNLDYEFNSLKKKKKYLKLKANIFGLLILKEVVSIKNNRIKETKNKKRQGYIFEIRLLRVYY